MYIREKPHTHTHTRYDGQYSRPSMLYVCIYNDDADRDDEATTTTLYLRYKTIVVG